MIAPFIDLGVHHKPRGLSDRIAFGITKALRWCAECLPHAALEPVWKKAA